MRFSRFSIAAALVCMLATVGCKTTESSSYAPFENLLPGKGDDSRSSERKTKPKKEEKIDYGEPVRLGVIWVDSIYTEVGKPAVRGFGGRFYFYDEDNEAIRVDGELVVYAFDDSSTQDSNKVPDRKYVFRQGELQTHHSETELGPSYSFWVPWDAVGGDRKKISLLPIFVNSDGRKVNGDQSIGILPGRIPGNDSEMYKGISRIMESQEVKPVNYEGPLDLAANRTFVQRATISVPDRLAERMRRAQEASLGGRGIQELRQQVESEAELTQARLNQQTVPQFEPMLKPQPLLAAGNIQQQHSIENPFSEFEPESEWTTKTGTGSAADGNVNALGSAGQGMNQPTGQQSVSASAMSINRSGSGTPQTNIRSSRPSMAPRIPFGK